MGHEALEVLSRGTAGLSRRGSLLTLGGATLAALGGSTSAEASKKKRKKARKKARRRCRRQKGQCLHFVDQHCADLLGCKEELVPCCDLFARCNAGAGLDCFFPPK